MKNEIKEDYEKLKKRMIETLPNKRKGLQDEAKKLINILEKDVKENTAKEVLARLLNAIQDQFDAELSYECGQNLQLSTTDKSMVEARNTAEACKIVVLSSYFQLTRHLARKRIDDKDFSNFIDSLIPFLKSQPKDSKKIKLALKRFNELWKISPKKRKTPAHNIGTSAYTSHAQYFEQLARQTRYRKKSVEDIVHSVCIAKETNYSSLARASHKATQIRRRVSSGIVRKLGMPLSEAKTQAISTRKKNES